MNHFCGAILELDSHSSHSLSLYWFTNYLCVSHKKRKLHRFETTWDWVNNGSVHFGGKRSFKCSISPKAIRLFPSMIALAMTLRLLHNNACKDRLILRDIKPSCWSIYNKILLLIMSHFLKCMYPCVSSTGQLAVGTCEIVMLNRDSSQPKRTIARQTARCACRRGQIAGTTRARPACVDGEMHPTHTFSHCVDVHTDISVHSMQQVTPCRSTSLLSLHCIVCFFVSCQNLVSHNVTQ